jgi:ABC-2 type transport system permease protein
MANEQALQMVAERGWRRGFANLLRQENAQWWRTRRWWVQSLFWLALINGSLGILLWIAPLLYPDAAVGLSKKLELFTRALGWWPMFAVITITQGSIIGEKQSGTAAWILSGPVSRAAFVLSKLIGNAIGFLFTVILLQGPIAYLQLSLSEASLLPVSPFVVALSIHSLYLLFYLSLTLMLGAFFNTREPVLGVALTIAVISLMDLGRSLGGLVSWAPRLTPEMLPNLAALAIQGEALPADWSVSIVAMSLYALLFVALAIWRFNREEF